MPDRARDRSRKSALVHEEGTRLQEPRSQMGDVQTDGTDFFPKLKPVYLGTGLAFSSDSGALITTAPRCSRARSMSLNSSLRSCRKSSLRSFIGSTSSPAVT